MSELQSPKLLKAIQVEPNPKYSDQHCPDWVMGLIGIGCVIMIVVLVIL